MVSLYRVAVTLGIARRDDVTGLVYAAIIYSTEDVIEYLSFCCKVPLTKYRSDREQSGDVNRKTDEIGCDDDRCVAGLASRKLNSNADSIRNSHSARRRRSTAKPCTDLFRGGGCRRRHSDGTLMSPLAGWCRHRGHYNTRFVLDMLNNGCCIYCCRAICRRCAAAG
jgi:hypothetical protein